MRKLLPLLCLGLLLVPLGIMFVTSAVSWTASPSGSTILPDNRPASDLQSLRVRLDKLDPEISRWRRLTELSEAILIRHNGNRAPDDERDLTPCEKTVPEELQRRRQTEVLCERLTGALSDVDRSGKLKKILDELNQPKLAADPALRDLNHYVTLRVKAEDTRQKLVDQYHKAATSLEFRNCVTVFKQFLTDYPFEDLAQEMEELRRLAHAEELWHSFLESKVGTDSEEERLNKLVEFMAYSKDIQKELPHCKTTAPDAAWEYLNREKTREPRLCIGGFHDFAVRFSGDPRKTKAADLALEILKKLFAAEDLQIQLPPLEKQVVARRNSFAAEGRVDEEDSQQIVLLVDNRKTTYLREALSETPRLTENYRRILAFITARKKAEENLPTWDPKFLEEFAEVSRTNGFEKQADYVATLVATVKGCPAFRGVTAGSEH